MNFYQILFSTDMIKANLAGRKNQTRRLNGLEEINKEPDAWHFIGSVPSTYKGKPVLEYAFERKNKTGRIYTTTFVRCPYGQPGDVLWVRETYSEYYDPHGNPYQPLFAYKADENSKPAKWKPSIHMPKSACRLFLKSKSIRPERIQEISERDARMEGVELLQPRHLYKNYMHGTEPAEGFSSPFSSFETLWRKINGAESWNSNEWVWRIQYDRMETRPDNFLQ